MTEVAGDRFNHGVYADSLRDILLSNRPGISVGLLGKWGQGKSTIVNLLHKTLSGKAQVVVFNAWKARGDSVRRQMLLEVLRQIGSGEYEKLRRFTNTRLPFALWTAEEREPFSSANIRHFLFKVRHLPLWIQGAIALATICAVAVTITTIGVYHGNSTAKDFAGSIAFLGGLVISSFAAVLGWFKETRKNELMVYTEPVSESLTLKYPEQFQRVFEQEVAKHCKACGRLIIVVDDLDRCEPATVVEVLAAIRQFSCGHIHDPGCAVQDSLDCQFLVPCDEEQLVLALESDGHRRKGTDVCYHNYRDELLRKFFDIVVRMDPPLPQDLVTYAETLVTSGVIDIDVSAAKEIIGVADPRDPRQVKKLLNALTLALDKAHRFHDIGLLPGCEEFPDLQKTLILLTALRETTPYVYDEICRMPDVLDNLSSLPLEKFNKTEIEKATTIRQRCGYVSSVTVSLLTSFHWDSRLSGIKDGPAFIKAVGDGDETSFKNILQQVEEGDRTRLLGFFGDNVTTTTRTPAQLRKSLMLLGDYGLLGDLHEKAAASVLDALLKTAGLHHYFPNALEGLARLDWISRQIPALHTDARDDLVEFVLQNYMKEPKTREHELRFLLQTPLLMREDLKSRFCGTLEKYLKDLKDPEWQMHVERIVPMLPSDQRQCAGFVPDLVPWMVQRLWTDDVRTKDPAAWSTPKLAAAMIGHDADKAKECLQNLFGTTGKLQSPQRIQSTPGIWPLWKFITHLMTILDPKSIPDFYPHLQKWLSQQSSKEEVECVLNAMKAQILAFKTPQLKEIAQVIFTSIQNQPDQTWALTYLPSKSAATSQKVQWDFLCQSFFAKFKEHALQNGVFPNWYQTILKRVVDDQWPITAEADILLGYKIRTQQESEKWFSNLEPVIRGECPVTRKDILARMAAQTDNITAFRMGIKVWTSNMEEKERDETCRAIASFLEKAPAAVLSSNSGELNAFTDISLAGAALDYTVDLLREDEKWLQGKEQLLGFLASRVQLLNGEHREALKRRAKFLQAQSDNVLKTLGSKVLDVMEENQKHTSTFVNDPT